MADQKSKKIFDVFDIFECLLPRNHLIKALYSLDSSRQSGRLLQNLQIEFPPVKYHLCWS